MSEGLLPEPALRTSRNMAYYDPRLAERIRAIKNLQQNHFLPLKMIGEMLEPPPSADVRADVKDTSHKQMINIAPGIREGQAAAREGRQSDSGPSQLSVNDILRTLELDEGELSFLQAAGLIEPDSLKTKDSLVGGSELDLLRVIHDTRVKNLGDFFPLEILPEYVDALRILVRMELTLFRRRVMEGAKIPDGSLMDIAREATHLSERLVVAMREKIMFAELETLIAPEGEESS